MDEIVLSTPKFGFIVATRAALGAGLGLLAGSKLRQKQRMRAGYALLALGALTTIPALVFVRNSLKKDGEAPAAAAV